MIIKQLNNKIPIIINHNDNIKTTSFGVFCKAGSLNETSQDNGISHFLEHMAFNGTKSRDYDEIKDTIGRIGAIINASTSYEITQYDCLGLSEHVETMLSVVCQNVTESTFPEKLIDKEKKIVSQEIAMYKDMPHIRVYELARAAMFPKSPLGFCILGPVENVNSITKAMLDDYTATHYTNDRMCISVVSNLDPDKIIEIANKNIGNYNNEGNVKSDSQGLLPKSDMSPYTFEFTDSEQYNITVSTHASGYFKDGKISRMHLCEKILSTIIGGSMSSRMFCELREKRGLCYSTHSFIEAHRNCGIFYMYIGTTNIDNIVAMVKEQLYTPIKSQEFEVAFNTTKTGLITKYEEIHSSYSIFGREYLKYGSIHSVDEICSILDTITLAEVEKAREDFVNKQYSVTCLGKTDIKA